MSVETQRNCNRKNNFEKEKKSEETHDPILRFTIKL